MVTANTTGADTTSRSAKSDPNGGRVADLSAAESKVTAAHRPCSNFYGTGAGGAVAVTAQCVRYTGFLAGTFTMQLAVLQLRQ